MQESSARSAQNGAEQYFPSTCPPVKLLPGKFSAVTYLKSAELIYQLILFSTTQPYFIRPWQKAACLPGEFYKQKEDVAGKGCMDEARSPFYHGEL